MLIKLRYLMCLIVVIVAFTTQVNADKIERCLICGMDISKYTHVKYVVTTTDGKEYTTCGVQCGLTLHLRLKNNFKSATATDLISHRTVDAKKAFYIYKSSAITDMAPGFITFCTKTNAEKFANGFGGQVVTYNDALEIWKKKMN